jgi:methyltransferase (TIGR00027 family)
MSSDRPELQNVSGTAFIIAEFRAEENEAVTPLYRDEIVRLFLNDRTKAIAERVAQTFPAAKEMVKVRTKYFDDVLLQQISQGCQQVVILGAGLDTRAVRQQVEGVNYFEIDCETTLQFKQECLSANRVSANVTYIPGDYVKDNLIDLLSCNNFDFELPTYFIWEGNITYLNKREIISILDTIRDRVKEFTLSFDYLSDRVIHRTTGHTDINDYINELEKIGAPWHSGFKNMENFLRSLGFEPIENLSTAELYEQYYQDRSLPSELLQFYFVCTFSSSR